MLCARQGGIKIADRIKAASQLTEIWGVSWIIHWNPKGPFHWKRDRRVRMNEEVRKMEPEIRGP